MKATRVSLLPLLLMTGLVPGGVNSEELQDRDCQSLRSVDFSGILDAPAQITETNWSDGGDQGPDHCEVRGYVAQHVSFVLNLPAKTWNGKLIEQGCGGFCGSTDTWTKACRDPLRRGYACIVSDMGHRSLGQQALWAYGNLQAQIDHAYRSAHVTVLAGKAIVERFYGLRPKKTYFTGCSTGGRQALMEAQRFPWDFDGIIAGAPSLQVTQLHMNLLWANRALKDRSGRVVLQERDIEILHQSAIRKCDGDDGIDDGVIGDPRSCKFEAEELLCGARSKSRCLTAEQISAARKIYSGPATSNGNPIFPLGAASKGSERKWLADFVYGFSPPDGVRNFFTEQFRYIAFDPAPGPGWTADDFNFDHDYKRLGGAQGLYDATNPDLRKFKEAGGKLIMYAGWNDASGLPLPAVDYYETVERTMGGREATQDFLRLFVIPGMGHCWWGDGAWSIDYLSYLEAWVERGQPPDKLIGIHPKGAQNSFPPPIEWRPEEIEFSRPIYPYPIKARYSGRGDSRDAASHGPVMP